MSKNDIESQLSFCFDVNSAEINDSKEEAASDRNIPYMNDSPSDDVESTAFDKLLGVYLELLGGDGASKVLARVKEGSATMMEG